MRKQRLAVGSSIIVPAVTAVLLAGTLPGLGVSADAVVTQDKIVLLTATAKAAYGNVAIANADGSGLKVIHKGSIADSPGDVAIAPAGNRVAEEFDNAGKDTVPSGLAVMNVDGSAYRVLVHGKSSEFFSSIAWNVAGTKLLVSVQNDGDGYLGLVDPTAAHPVLVKIKGSVGLAEASFSPASDATIVASDASGALVTLTAGHTTTLLSPSQSGFIEWPVFSPDGGTIAFSMIGLSGTALVGRIETISADGTVGPTPIIDSGVNFLPVWSSDGQTIYYTAFDLTTGVGAPYHVPVGGGTPVAIGFPAGKTYILTGVARPDTTPPVAPAAPHVSLNGAHPVVSWQLPADVDVSKVIVRRLAGTVAPATPADGSPVYTGRGLTVTDAVTAGQTYTYAAWAVDGAGNVSAASPAKTFLALQAPVIKSPPLVSSVSLGLTFPVSWAPAAANPPSTPYTVQWRVPGGTWATWQSSVTTTSARFGQGNVPVRPAAGHTYALRAFVTDEYGNTSLKPASTFVELKDDRSASAKGGWSNLHTKTSWLGTSRATTHAKASLSIGLTGSTLWLVGDRLPHGSRADVYVDGKKVATIDTHGSTAHRHILWSKRVKKGHHVLKVVNLATKGRAHLSVDGFASS